ncbi:MAG: hypothetical protein DMD36_10130 [Gemmatimonadetes bacterium]|nr:MAG: hypothetical protein DMD36_10130 [Gemmatimonadota bacterium]
MEVRQPHARHQPAQLLADGLGDSGRGISLGEEQSGAERKVSDGDVGALGLADHVSAPVHGSELGDRFPAPARIPAHGRRAPPAPDHLDVARVEAHDPAGARPMRATQQIECVLEVGRQGDGLPGEPEPHERAEG